MKKAKFNPASNPALVVQTVELPTAIAGWVAARAKQNGQTLNQFVIEMLEAERAAKGGAR